MQFNLKILFIKKYWYIFWAPFWKMAIKRSSEFLRLGTFFGHSRYNTKFKKAKIPFVANCSNSNHKCPWLLVDLFQIPCFPVHVSILRNSIVTIQLITLMKSKMCRVDYTIERIKKNMYFSLLLSCLLPYIIQIVLAWLINIFFHINCGTE